MKLRQELERGALTAQALRFCMSSCERQLTLASAQVTKPACSSTNTTARTAD